MVNEHKQTSREYNVHQEYDTVYKLYPPHYDAELFGCAHHSMSGWLVVSAIASKPLHGNKLKMRGQQTVVEVAGFHSKLANSFSYFSCYVIAHNSVLWINDKEVTARIDKNGEF